MTVLHTFFRTNSCKNSRYSVFRKKKSYVLEAYFFFFNGFTPCKAEQPIQGKSYTKNKHKKIKAYRKSL